MSTGRGGGFFRVRTGMRAGVYRCSVADRTRGRPSLYSRGDQGGNVPSVTIHDFRVTDAVLAQTDPDAGDVVYLGPAGNALREQVRKWLGQSWSGTRKAEFERYFTLAPREKAEYLDRAIDRSEQMRKEREQKVRAPNPPIDYNGDNDQQDEEDDDDEGADGQVPSAATISRHGSAATRIMPSQPSSTFDLL